MAQNLTWEPLGVLFVLLLCVWVLPVCVSLHYLCTVPKGARKGHWWSPGIRLLKIMSHHWGSSNETQALWKQPLLLRYLSLGVTRRVWLAKPIQILQNASRKSQTLSCFWSLALLLRMANLQCFSEKSCRSRRKSRGLEVKGPILKSYESKSMLPWAYQPVSSQIKQEILTL